MVFYRATILLCFLLLLLGCSNSIAESDNTELDDSAIELELSTAMLCLKKTKKDFPKLKLTEGISFMTLVFSTRKKVMDSAKCFTKCFLERSGLFAGRFNMDAIRERFGDSISESFLQECAAKGDRKTKPCSRAFTPFMCLLENETLRSKLVVTLYGDVLGKKVLLKYKDKAKEIIMQYLKKMFS